MGEVRWPVDVIDLNFSELDSTDSSMRVAERCDVM